MPHDRDALRRRAMTDPVMHSMFTAIDTGIVPETTAYSAALMAYSDIVAELERKLSLALLKVPVLIVQKRQ